MFKKNSLNLISLIAIQGSNAILPLIIFPYILTKLGASIYSDIVVGESIMLISFAFIIYSFEVNGVSKVLNLIEADDKKTLSKLYLEILVIRLLVFLLIFTIALSSFFFLERDFFYILILWFLFPLSFILQGSYFYLGAENNCPLAIIVVLSRLLCICLIYYFINPNSPSYYVPLIIGAFVLIGGGVSNVYLIFNYKLKLSKLTFTDLKKLLIDGKEIFLGNISVLLFKDLNILIIKLITNSDIAISSYSISEKIIKSIQATTRPLNQFFFPKSLRLIKNIKRPNIKSFMILGKSTIIQLVFLSIISIFIVIILLNFADNISFLNSIPNINFVFILCSIMIVSVFFGVMNFMFGSVGLNHLNAKKYFAFALFITGISTIIVSYTLVSYFGAYGAALSFVFAEVILFAIISKKYL